MQNRSFRPVTAAAALTLLTLALSFVMVPSSRAVAANSVNPASMTAMPGLLNLYWDASTGKLWLEPGKMNVEMLYVSSLARGIGSNDLGLDRGQLGKTRVVEFQRAGPRILLVEKNTRFRAQTDNTDERAAVAASFAGSVLWGFDSATAPDGHALIDVTDFLLRDTHGIAATLAAAGEGNYKEDVSRSAVWPRGTRGFPRNSDMEAMVTFTGQPTGQWLGTVLEDADSFTVHFHHSFVAMPEPGFEALPLDPRSGYLYGNYGPSHQDYATPIHEPLRRPLTPRHRLKRKDATAARGEAVAPIVYYLDRGVPEPVRSALMDGASWWNQAFEAAGYSNGFRVEMLPEDADPLDVRYNVIQWVHRSTRGWSYGASVVDPRTGEIVKGHVSLGSLRVRQDYLIAEGLLSPYTQAGQAVSTRARELALARIRQLAAHEVGHTLGLAHNFAASTLDRASVMDYPHPLATVLPDGSIDVSQAYATGIGAWDSRAITYGYKDFAPGTDVAAARAAILSETVAGKLAYITDEDAWPAGAAHPLAHLWDNGTDPVDELKRLSRVRRAALEQFSEAAIPVGQPLATLEEVLVPLYLMHRYQLQAAARVLGGQYYRYNLRGDGQPLPRVVDSEQQGRALDALLDTLQPQFLRLPEQVIDTIPPRPPGVPLTREAFPRHTGVVFDPLGAASASVDLTLGQLLNRERASRLERFKARGLSQPGFSDVVNTLLDMSWRGQRQSGYDGMLHRMVNDRVLEALMALAGDAGAELSVRAVATAALKSVAARAPKDAADLRKPYAVQAQQAAVRIGQFFAQATVTASDGVKVPPGSPIGIN